MPELKGAPQTGWQFIRMKTGMIRFNPGSGTAGRGLPPQEQSPGIVSYIFSAQNRVFLQFFRNIYPVQQARAQFNMINNEKFPYSEREGIWCNSYNCWSF
jgi:hypothetical protein